MSGTVGKSTWYYRPTHSANYPGVSNRDPFIRQLPSSSKPAAAGQSGTRALGSLRSAESQAKWVTRMSTPTTASKYRFQCPSQSFSYTKRTLTWDGHMMWGRMDVFRDTHKCLWSRYGAVKQGKQI